MRSSDDGYSARPSCGGAAAATLQSLSRPRARASSSFFAADAVADAACIACIDSPRS